MTDRKVLVARLKKALLECDMPAMQLAMIDFPGEEGPIEVLRILQGEVPDSIRTWWLEEDCDSPHDPLDMENEVLTLAEHVLKQRRKGER